MAPGVRLLFFVNKIALADTPCQSSAGHSTCTGIAGRAVVAQQPHLWHQAGVLRRSVWQVALAETPCQSSASSSSDIRSELAQRVCGAARGSRGTAVQMHVELLKSQQETSLPGAAELSSEQGQSRRVSDHSHIASQSDALRVLSCCHCPAATVLGTM